MSGDVGQKWVRFLCMASLAVCLAGGFGCEKKRPRVNQSTSTEENAVAESTSEPSPEPRTSAAANPKATPEPRLPSVAVSTQPPPAEIWREFKGQNALDTAGKLVGLGPRPAGSPALDSARRLLVSGLEAAAWEVERDAFQTAAPNGSVSGVNLIARFSADGSRPVARTPRSILVVAAYDTRAFSTIQFVGANDGASGPAMLLEIARVLSLNPRLAERVELLLADASEPRQQFTPTDGVAGSRHYLSRVDPKSLRRVLVLGGVGANGENLTVPPDTAADIWQEATQGCSRLGQPMLLRKLDRYMWGDHVPFTEAGISSLYLGNHDYLARYTADDRLDKLSAASLERVGQFATWLVAQWAQR